MNDIVVKTYKRLEKEYQEYIDNLKKLSKEEIITRAYEIVCKTEIKQFFYNNTGNEEARLKELLKLDNSLDYLYQDWLKVDGGINYELEQSIIDSLFELEEQKRIKKIEKER